MKQSNSFLSTCQENIIFVETDNIMNIMTVGEFKTHFSRALKMVQAGEEIAISYGKNKEIVARLVPKSPAKKSKRKLGLWDSKGKVKFNAGFKMTEKEFLGQ